MHMALYKWTTFTFTPLQCGNMMNKRNKELFLLLLVEPEGVQPPINKGILSFTKPNVANIDKLTSIMFAAVQE